MSEQSCGFGVLRPMRIGILLALAAIALGFGLGGAFGAFEHRIKEHLQASGAAVQDTVYQGDSAAMKKVTNKAWGYMKRAHLHAGAMGTVALALSLMLGFFDGSSRLLRGLTSAALGAGALGYAVFWLLAALRAPSMGGTGAAKESLRWLALPSTGLVVIGVLAAFVLLVPQMSDFGKRSTRES